MNVAAIIPYGGDDPYRQRNLQHVLAYYAEVIPGATLMVARNWGTFHKALAVNLAVRALPSYITTLILNDADSLCHRSSLASAVAMAHEAEGIVFAFTVYHNVGEEETAACRTWRDALYADDWERSQPTSESHGCVVMSRETFETVGGYDERFTGWGYEDLAFNITCEARWPSRRTGWPLVHLWHPPAEENPLNGELYARYQAARGDVRALDALRDEVLSC